MTEIVEVKDFIPAYTDAVQKLLEQLTNRPVKLTGTTLRDGCFVEIGQGTFRILCFQTEFAPVVECLEICRGNADCRHLSQPHRRQSVD